ncbi:hypothetical protein [Cellulomonas wangsupingiae]|uniref:Uncharacterized protein n=1 Tax=Cellulomonas wangsupingiae TaxID=2968085 RepID=A0ABY5K3G3_9CELL|nr:hypothetical protein [Cellulomonas wangsupingiae]MCC2336029.1 hypothetical protein [Cellulomonas wangsupingiae]MCM0639660.1 hypothetical protein [Cellulomonas wangsupingiae]UUI64754.1 hypothetical protein NP075_16815 [Cellulomonas wangsupingiae]
MRWSERSRGRQSVRWSSLLLVVGCGALALVCLVAALRGRPLALVPGLVAAAVALREVRVLRRGRRSP